MDLERLVVGAGEDQLAVGRDRDRTDCSGVLLDYLRVSFDGVVPQADGGVRRARGDQLARCRHFDVVDRTIMTDKSEGAHRRLEVPDHDCAVRGARHDLLQIRIECDSAHGVLVAFEGALERWITRWLS